jgi:diketogulonate reductase-like aldo/keto reductase
MQSANGIPLLGFGTFPLRDDEVERCVAIALEVGFRHVDTAQMYGNEKQVGRALKASGLPRRELYVVTKIDPGSTTAKYFGAAAERSVEALGGPVDLLIPGAARRRLTPSSTGCGSAAAGWPKISASAISRAPMRRAARGHRSG